jgi:pyruvate dehydrogenase E2 component (dihydrolipoamide acetyltransferase)
MTQGVIAEWCVKEGDTIKANSVIARVETDKATVDFEATDESVLGKILVPGGEVPVGRVVAVLVEDAAAAAAFKGLTVEAVLAELGGGGGSASKSSSGAAPASAAAAEDVGRSCSGLRTINLEEEEEDGPPAVAAKVASLGASAIFPSARALLLNSHYAGAIPVGTGKDGRITKGDVLAAMGKAPPQLAAAAAATSKAPASSSSSSAAAVAPSPASPSAAASSSAAAPAFVRASGRGFSDSKPSTVRKVIAARLTESKATIPHSYAVIDCNIDALTALRLKLKEGGVNVSVNDMVIAAAAKALKAVPEANAFFDARSGRIVANGSVDISVAVATDGGLITPIVKGADTLGLTAINAKVKDLAGRARAGKLKPEEFIGGSFTISNLGMFGSINEFSAVINPPQACILAVGKGEQRVVLPPGAKEPSVATVMTVQLSSDARVVEPHVAGQFLACLRAYLQDPATMFVKEMLA